MPKRRISSESLDSNRSTSTTASYQPLQSRRRYQQPSTPNRYSDRHLVHGNVACVGTFGDSQFDQTHANANETNRSEQELLFNYYHRNDRLFDIQDSDEDEELDIENDVAGLLQSDDETNNHIIYNNRTDDISEHASSKSGTKSNEMEPSELDSEDSQEDNSMLSQEDNSMLSDASKPSSNGDHDSYNDNNSENSSENSSENGSANDSDNSSENGSENDSENGSDDSSDHSSETLKNPVMTQEQVERITFLNSRDYYQQSVGVNAHKDLPDEENKSSQLARSLFTVHPGPKWYILGTEAQESVKVFLHDVTCIIYSDDVFIECVLLPAKSSDYVYGDFESILCTTIPRTTLHCPTDYICMPSSKINLGQALNGQYNCVLSWRGGGSFQTTLVTTNLRKPRAFIVPNELIPCSIRSIRKTISSVIHETKIDNDLVQDENYTLKEILSKGLPITSEALFTNFLIIPYQSKEVICRVCTRKSPPTDQAIRLIFYSPKTLNLSLIIPKAVDKDSLLPVNSIVGCVVLFPDLLIPCACVRLVQGSQSVVHLIFTSILPCSIRSARLTVRYIPFIPIHRSEKSLVRPLRVKRLVYKLSITTVEADVFLFEMRKTFEAPWYAIQFGVMTVEEDVAGPQVQHWMLIQTEAGQFDQIPRDCYHEARVTINGSHLYYCAFFSPSETPWKGYIVDDSAPGFYEPRNPQINFPPTDFTNEQIHELVMRRRKSMHYRLFVFYDRPLNMLTGERRNFWYRLYAESTMTNDVDFTRISIIRMLPREIARYRSERRPHVGLSNHYSPNHRLTDRAHPRQS